MRKNERLMKQYIKATSAVRNKYDSRITKKAVQCVIVIDLGVNNGGDTAI